jgi:hypothetical protein
MGRLTEFTGPYVALSGVIVVIAQLSFHASYSINWRVHRSYELKKGFVRLWFRGDSFVSHFLPFLIVCHIFSG